MKDAYFRFINIIRALDGPIVPAVDPSCIPLLEKICSDLAIHNKSYMVNELLAMKFLGSQATIHKKLHLLVDNGFVDLVPQTDGRLKMVSPTKKANKLFAQLDKLILKSLKS